MQLVLFGFFNVVIPVVDELATNESVEGRQQDKIDYQTDVARLLDRGEYPGHTAHKLQDQGDCGERSGAWVFKIHHRLDHLRHDRQYNAGAYESKEILLILKCLANMAN